MFNLSAEDFDEIKRQQRLEYLRLFSTLMPYLKGSLPHRITATEVEMRSRTPNDPEPLTEEIFNKYISLPPRTGPPYVTKGIGSLISSDEEIKPFPLPELPPYLMGIKSRRKRMTKKKMLKEIRREQRRLDNVISQVSTIRIDVNTLKEETCLYLDPYGEETIGLDEVVQMIMDRLGIKLQVTKKRELVAVKKFRKKVKRKTHKSKKK